MIPTFFTLLRWVKSRFLLMGVRSSLRCGAVLCAPRPLFFYGGGRVRVLGMLKKIVPRGTYPLESQPNNMFYNIFFYLTFS